MWGWGYYLFTTSVKLTLIYLLIMIFKFICDYLHDYFSEFSNWKSFHKIMEQYNACLNEFLSNIRLVKSFGTEEEEINKLKNLKNRIERNIFG